LMVSGKGKVVLHGSRGGGEFGTSASVAIHDDEKAHLKVLRWCSLLQEREGW
jgi:hypothetical protein